MSKYKGHKGGNRDFASTKITSGETDSTVFQQLEALAKLIEEDKIEEDKILDYGTKVEEQAKTIANSASKNKFHEYLVIVRTLKNVSKDANWKKEFYRHAISLKYIASKDRKNVFAGALAKFIVGKLISLQDSQKDLLLKRLEAVEWLIINMLPHAKKG